MAIDNLVVETGYGPVRGADTGPTGDRVRAWKGIRYAAPPVGDLRFRGPEPPRPWTEVADATEFGPACPQPVFPNMPLDLGAPQGEDCLRLNVWASPDLQARRRKTGAGVAARWRVRPGIRQPGALRRSPAGRQRRTWGSSW